MIANMVKQTDECFGRAMRMAPRWNRVAIFVHREPGMEAAFHRAFCRDQFNIQQFNQGGDTVKITRLVSQLALAGVLILLVSVSSHAAILDLTVFGGFQDPGKLTFETAPGSATNLIQHFDPKTFGVFGARFGHGGLLGGEHTLAYAPNFLDNKTHSVIYHSNLRIQPTISFVKPYVTAGVGVVYTGGDSPASFGAKFGFNYGGGVTLTGGMVGVNLDVRGYSVPQISVAGYTTQDRLDFIQASAGISFHF